MMDVSVSAKPLRLQLEVLVNLWAPDWRGPSPSPPLLTRLWPRPAPGRRWDPQPCPTEWSVLAGMGTQVVSEENIFMSGKFRSLSLFSDSLNV